MIQIELSSEVVQSAVDAASGYKLRGADAVHLASALKMHKLALEIGESMLFVACDDELLRAAKAAELLVNNPTAAA